MKIRYFSNLVFFFSAFTGIAFIILFAIIWIMASAEDKSATLSSFVIAALCTVLLVALINIFHLLLCKKYVQFTDAEIIEIKGNDTRVLVKYSDIFSAEYCNVMYQLVGNTHGGILYLKCFDENKKIIVIDIPISLRNLKKLRDKGLFLPIL